MTTETEKLPALWKSRKPRHADAEAAFAVCASELVQALARDRANDMTLIDGLCGQVNELRAADNRDRVAQGEVYGYVNIASNAFVPVAAFPSEWTTNRCWLPVYTHPPVADTPCKHKFRHDAGIEPYCVRCGIKEVDDLLSGDAKVTP